DRLRQYTFPASPPRGGALMPIDTLPRAVAVAMLLGGRVAHAFEIVSTSPPRLARAIQPTLAAIAITFDAPVVLPPAAAFRVAGNMSGLDGGVLEADGATLRLRNLTRAFLPGEVVTVNLRSDVHAQGGGALTGGRMFTFTIASSPCTPD